QHPALSGADGVDSGQEHRYRKILQLHRDQVAGGQEHSAFAEPGQGRLIPSAYRIALLPERRGSAGARDLPPPVAVKPFGVSVSAQPRTSAITPECKTPCARFPRWPMRWSHLWAPQQLPPNERHDARPGRRSGSLRLPG
nr:hypothetical protein [Tanacetum cinerariifolium]